MGANTCAPQARMDRSMILNVITALSRPENLPVLHNSLRVPAPNWEFRWYIGADSVLASAVLHVDGAYKVIAKAGVGNTGNPHRNAILDAIPVDTSWVWFLDDDNLPVEGFFEALHQAVIDHPHAVGFVFDQTNAMQLRATEVVAGLAPVDTAMFAFRRDAIGDLRWHPTKYDADGQFFADMRSRFPDRIIPISKALASHNILRPETHDWIKQGR